MPPQPKTPPNRDRSGVRRRHPTARTREEGSARVASATAWLAAGSVVGLVGFGALAAASTHPASGKVVTSDSSDPTTPVTEAPAAPRTPATNGPATNGSATNGSATDGSATNGSATNGSATSDAPATTSPAPQAPDQLPQPSHGRHSHVVSGGS